MKKAALNLLSSPEFFSSVLVTVKRLGLVGEKKKALVVFLVATSRLLNKPLNLFVKGASSAGKNFLVKTVLGMFPEDAVTEITSVSDKGLYYLEEDLQHRVVYFQEENEASQTVHPTRLLLSEGKLVRRVTERVGNSFRTVQHETKGPIACISTTTEDRLAVDDESRHLSIWIDESPEQTANIIASSLDDAQCIRPIQLKAWHEAQGLLAERASLPFELPSWFRSPVLLGSLNTGDVRVRRYFPAFAQACKVVCLVRSFQRKRKPRKLIVSFEDFAVTAIIFDRVFAESLKRPSDRDLEVKRIVERLSAAKRGKPVRATELAEDQHISRDRAYTKLRRAARAGTVIQANPPTKGNLKLFLPAPPKRFLPEPGEVFLKVDRLHKRVEFIHPLTGKRAVYARDPCRE